MLSVRGASALVARRIRTYGETSEADVLVELERYEMTSERAREAVDLAVVRNQVVRSTTPGGTVVLTQPVEWWREAA